MYIYVWRSTPLLTMRWLGYLPHLPASSPRPRAALYLVLSGTQ